MIIKTKGFVLRPPKLSDARNIYEYQQEKEVKKNFMAVPKNINEAKKEIRAYLKSKFKKGIIKEHFVIEVNGKVVGEIGFRAKDPYNQTKAKITYWIAKKVRGKGITTKALKLVTNYAFKKYKIKRMIGVCRTFNKGSARILEKAGYKLEGILKKDAYKNGKHYDNMVWAKVR